MKELLLLSLKEVHLIYEDGIYQQTDGVAMGSLLGPLLDRIFIVELEATVVPILDNVLFKWKRHVDNPFCFVKSIISIYF